jgi:hypothetical protein
MIFPIAAPDTIRPPSGSKNKTAIGLIPLCSQLQRNTNQNSWLRITVGIHCNPPAKNKTRVRSTVL